MNRRRIRTAGSFVCLAVATLASGACHRHGALHHARQPDVIAFSNVTIVRPEAGVAVPNQTLIARGGRIAFVGDASRATIPGDAFVVVGTGLFLMPGLHDLHVHHFGSRDRARAYTEPDLLLYPAHGVTTVRIMAGSDDALRARERIRASRLLGPRLVVCSQQISRRWQGATPDSAAQAVRRFHAAGYDCIKLYGGLSAAVFNAAIRTADSLGMPTAGHASARLPFALALRLGSIEHIEEIQWHFGERPLTEAEHGAMVDSLVAAAVPIVPTIGSFDFSAYLDDDRYATLLARESTAYVPELLFDRQNELAMRRERGEDLDSLAQAWRAQYERALQHANFLHERGVTLPMGTDAGAMLTVPGFAAAIELETMVAAGLSPAEALRSATTDAADFLGLATGRVEAGYLSDLVLLNANPLLDISAVRDIRGVLIGSTWLDRRALDEGLARIRRR